MYLLKKNIVFFKVDNQFVTAATQKQKFSLMTETGKPLAFIGIPSQDGEGEVYLFSSIGLREVNDQSGYRVNTTDLFLPDSDEFKVGSFVTLKGKHVALICQDNIFSSREKQTTLGHKLAHYVLGQAKTVRLWRNVKDSSGILAELRKALAIFEPVHKSIFEKEMTPGNHGHRFAKQLFYMGISSLSELHKAVESSSAEKLAQSFFGDVSAEEVVEAISSDKFSLDPDYHNKKWPIDYEYVALLQDEQERRKLESSIRKRTMTSVSPHSSRKELLIRDKQLREEEEAQAEKWRLQEEASARLENESRETIIAINELIENPITKEKMNLLHEFPIGIFSSEGVVFSDDSNAVQNWSSWHPGKGGEVSGIGSGKIVSSFKFEGLIPGVVQLIVARDFGKVVARVRFVRADN